jgi:hypothetical protein
LNRASQSFFTPLGTLDALHLASAASRRIWWNRFGISYPRQRACARRAKCESDGRRRVIKLQRPPLPVSP